MTKYVFPEDFKWGISNSAFQIEGAWNEDGKGPSIWDDFCHELFNVADHKNGDVAIDFYHRYEDDIALMEKFGFTMVRFSVAWTRVIPDGIGEINPKGIDFYQKVVKCMRAHHIEPICTLFHWDLPSAIWEKGGYAHPDFPDWFTRYADIVIGALSPWVDRFFTFNQPYSLYKSVAEEVRAPAAGNPKLGFLSGLGTLIAHGRTVRMVRDKYPDKKIGIVLNLVDCMSVSNNELDRKATEWMDVKCNSQFLLPLFRKEYPLLLREHVEMWNIRDRFEDEAVLEEISSPIDFIGVNFYQNMLVGAKNGNWKETVQVHDIDRYDITGDGRDINPQSFRNVLERVHTLDSDLEIMITENGAEYKDELDDLRIKYMEDHLVVLHKAIQDGIPVKAYLAWTFIDNYEWNKGYTNHYGLCRLGSNLERIPKQSAYWYERVVKSNSIVIQDV